MKGKEPSVRDRVMIPRKIRIDSFTSGINFLHLLTFISYTLRLWEFAWCQLGKKLPSI